MPFFTWRPPIVALFRNILYLFYNHVGNICIVSILVCSNRFYGLISLKLYERKDEDYIIPTPTAAKFLNILDVPSLKRQLGYCALYNIIFYIPTVYRVTHVYYIIIVFA